jgi:hypothetical protein
LVFEIALWYPPGAHHLDDEPALLLRYEERGLPKVEVPYLGGDPPPYLLRWSANAAEIAAATRAVIRDFAVNFLADTEPHATLYNRILNKFLETSGRLEKAIFDAITRALDEDTATSVAWAESKLAILRQRLGDRRPVWVFDRPPGSPIETMRDVDAYLAARLGTHR